GGPRNAILILLDLRGLVCCDARVRAPECEARVRRRGDNTMAIEVKVLGPQDAGALENVAPGGFDDPIDIHGAVEFLADPRHYLAVAVDEGLIGGFVSAVHYVHPDKSRPEMWINEVGVAETHQGRGLGKRLLRAVFDVARGLGCAEAWVLTDRANT